MPGHRICMIGTGRKIGCRIDAAGDGRAPGAIALPNALWERDGSCPHTTVGFSGWSGET